jgi:Domain of unknown function (DUF4129)
MNFFDQVNWQTGRAFRQATEWTTYFFQQLLSQPQGESSAGPDWLEPLVIWITRCLFLILILGLILGIWRFLWPLWQRWRSPLPVGEVGQYRAIAPNLSVNQWLAQAKRFHSQGDDAAACRCLYLAMLLGMEQGGWLSQDPARTNREYLRGLEVDWQMGKRPLDLRAAVKQIFSTHDQVYYGGQPVTTDTWERCHQAYQSLEPELHKPSLSE